MRKAEIENLTYNADAEQSAAAAGTDSSGNRSRSRVAAEDILLYEQQKKSIAVGVGLEVFGAGLIHAENYWLGIPLFLTQNAMLIASPFVQERALALVLGGSVLKTTDTIMTIIAINSYNRDLSQRIGITESPGHSFGPTGHSIDPGLNATFIRWGSTGSDESTGELQDESGDDTFIAPQFGWMFPGSRRFSWGLFATGGLASGSDDRGGTRTSPSAVLASARDGCSATGWGVRRSSWTPDSWYRLCRS